MTVLTIIQSMNLIHLTNLSSSLLLLLFVAVAHEANMGKLQIVKTLFYKFAHTVEMDIEAERKWVFCSPSTLGASHFRRQSDTS